jgi:hypothetical protein
MPKGPIGIVDVGPWSVGRANFEPGWNFKECVMPIVKTPSCQQRHALYVLQGRMGLRMDDGTEAEIGPGDVVSIDPGHDAWIVGNETFVCVDFHRKGD